MTRILKYMHLNLPDLSAFLIAGVLIGPYVLGQLGIQGLGFTSAEAVSDFSLISKIALGFISFTIGSEFRLSEIKKTGAQSIVVALFEGLTACIFVAVALIGVHLIWPDKFTLSQAITLGAIAIPTAPAITIMVVRQYKSKGPLTSLLLQDVALDDALALIVFAIAFGIAKTLASGEVDLIAIIINPLLEIVLSLGLGILMGWLLTQLEKLFYSNSNRLNISIAMVFLAASLSMLEFQIGPLTIKFSSLLTCMMFGAAFRNICPLSDDMMSRIDKWTSPLFALFFVLSGADLDFGVFSDLTIVLIGLVYILIRCLGKFIGARFGSKLMKCPSPSQKWLGSSLFPQAGVALGMSIMALELGTQGVLIHNIALFAVLVYEIVGPLFTKFSLSKAGEITKGREAAEIRQGFEQTK